MVMMSTLLIGKLPFKTVFLHPIIRDSQGRKMSKVIYLIDFYPIEKFYF
jgi:valyl-tRNA synthetase